LENTIEGLAQARNAGLSANLIVSGGVAEPAQKAALELGHRLGMDEAITFTGPYTQENAPDVYRAADAYITTTYNDNCPSGVIEALACGLPVIYSHSGGVPELVGDDAGVGLPCPEDWERTHSPTPRMIAEAMQKVSENRTAMARSARERAVKRFDTADWLARHEAVFQNLLLNHQ
jgi:glycosyltransferase involved in cell wall biosynthesis